MSIRSWPRRIRDSIEQEGVWRLLFRMALSPVYEAGALRAEPLLRQRDFPHTHATVRSAGEVDMAALVALRPECTLENLRSRLGDGHECGLALVNGMVVGCLWACAGAAPLGSFGLILPLRQHEAYLYDTYVHPANRRKDVNTAIRRHLDEKYWHAGFTTHVDFATLGRKPWGRNDRHLVATIRVLRLGPFRKLWVRTCGPKAGYWQGRLKELRWA